MHSQNTCHIYSATQIECDTIIEGTRNTYSRLGVIYLSTDISINCQVIIEIIEKQQTNTSELQTVNNSDQLSQSQVRDIYTHRDYRLQSDISTQ